MQILILRALYSIFWIFYKLNPEKGLATIILKLQSSIKLQLIKLHSCSGRIRIWNRIHFILNLSMG
jgi:hypothetical protein